MPMPGTTRDVVSGTLEFGGVPAEILDTAGIRAIPDELDTAEAEGIRRSWREVERAHLVLIVLDISAPLTDEDVALMREARVRTLINRAPLLLVCNKIDLPTAWEPAIAAPFLSAVDLTLVTVSAKTGERIDLLRANVRELLGLEINPEEMLLTDSRHLALFEEVGKILTQVRDGLSGGTPQDVAATELWGADRALGRLLGEDLGAVDLDEIFSRFCVGK